MDNLTQRIQEKCPLISNIYSEPQEKCRGSYYEIKFGNTGVKVDLNDNFAELHFTPNNFTGDLELTPSVKFWHSLMLVAGLHSLANYWNSKNTVKPLPDVLGVKTHLGLHNQLKNLTCDFSLHGIELYTAQKSANVGKFEGKFDITSFAFILNELQKNHDFEYLVTTYTFFKRLSVTKSENCWV